MKPYTVVLTQPQLDALDRAIGDLPKRIWDQFVRDAAPFIGALNQQLQAASAMPATEPPRPPAQHNGNGEDHEAMPPS